MGRQTKLKQQQELEKFVVYDKTIKDRKFIKERRGKGRDPESVYKQMPKLLNFKEYFIRDLKDWKAKSYSPIKQQYELIDWLLVDYTVPSFMYEIFFKDISTSLKDEFGKWFITLAQGGSFPRLVKNVLTKKEAYNFIKAPDGNSIIKNVWYARFKAEGIGQVFIRELLKRNINNLGINNLCWQNFIKFFSKQQDYATPQDLSEILDYVEHMVRTEPNFEFFGRTWLSLVRLSNTWHEQFRNIPKIYKGMQQVSWTGSPTRDWERTLKFKGSQEQEWHIIQLKNSKSLWSEGSSQGHCVGSYVQSCLGGHSAIFTMEFRNKNALTWKKLITIELQGSKVVQTKGKFNRQPTPEEKGVIRLWASENGLSAREA